MCTCTVEMNATVVRHVIQSSSENIKLVDTISYIDMLHNLLKKQT
jgi:hypothetical protein